MLLTWCFILALRSSRFFAWVFSTGHAEVEDEFRSTLSFWAVLRLCKLLLFFSNCTTLPCVASNSPSLVSTCWAFHWLHLVSHSNGRRLRRTHLPRQSVSPFPLSVYDYRLGRLLFPCYLREWKPSSLRWLHYFTKFEFHLKELARTSPPSTKARLPSIIIFFWQTQHSGIRGVALDWVRSYVSSRLQFVQFNSQWKWRVIIAVNLPI